jgi:hypothetical protein
LCRCSQPSQKQQYHSRLCEYLDTYDKAFIVHADNVGSKQFSDIRAVRWVWGVGMGMDAEQLRARCLLHLVHAAPLLAAVAAVVAKAQTQ